MCVCVCVCVCACFQYGSPCSCIAVSTARRIKIRDVGLHYRSIYNAFGYASTLYTKMINDYNDINPYVHSGVQRYLLTIFFFFSICRIFEIMFQHPVAHMYSVYNNILMHLLQRGTANAEM